MGKAIKNKDSPDDGNERETDQSISTKIWIQSCIRKHGEEVLIMPPIAAALPAIGGWLSSALAGTLVMPSAAAMGGIGAGLGAASTIGNMVMGNQQKVAANDASREARAQWQANAFPSDSVVNAQATQNRGQLGQARLGATQNVGSQLAARGFGPGSGAMAGAMGNINKGYLEGLGSMNTELTKFKNTPMFPFPQQGYASPTSSTWSGLGNATDMMDTASGLMFARSIFPNMFGNK